MDTYRPRLSVAGDSSVDELKSLANTMIHKPVSIEAMGSARKILDRTRRAEIGVAKTSNGLREARRTIIETSIRFWEWLDITIPQLVTEYLKDIRPGTGKPYGVSENWLQALTRDVAGMVFYNQGSLAVTLPDSLEVPKRTFTITNSTKRRQATAASDPAFQGHVVGKVTSAILLSLQASRCKYEQARAWALSMLRRLCGVRFLGLNCAWDVFVNFKLSDFTDSSLASVKRADIERCEEEIADHLDKTGVGSLLSLFESEGGLAVLTHDQLVNLHSDEWGDLWMFLQTSMRILRGLEVNGNEKLQNLASMLRQDPTGCLPFREKVPEVQRTRGEGGFYHPDHVNTTAGIFSALVWRVISFGSPFARERRMVYGNDEDYLKEVKTCPSVSYTFRPNAYGHPITKHGPSLATRFWRSLTEGSVARWEEFTNERPTFQECLAYFRQRNGKTNLFPGLGNLISFLLVCDLSYAGVCPPPDDLELGGCILQNGGGSLKELVALGLVPPDNSASDHDEQAHSVVDGLNEVIGFLENHLTKEEIEGIGLDAVCVEHILCKTHKLGVHLQGCRLETEDQEAHVTCSAGPCG